MSDVLFSVSHLCSKQYQLVLIHIFMHSDYNPTVSSVVSLTVNPVVVFICISPITNELRCLFIFCVCASAFSSSVVSDSLRPFRLQLTRLLCPWDFSGKNTGVDYHFSPPGDLPSPRDETFPSSPVFLALQEDSLPLSHQGSPFIC